VRLNENRQWVVPVLRDIKELKAAYRSAVKADEVDQCDDAADRVRTALGVPEHGRVLDTLLGKAVVRTTRQFTFTRELHERLVEVEQNLGHYFGYSPSEVEEYIRAASIGVGEAAGGQRITETADLLAYFNRSHDQAKEDLQEVAATTWWKRRGRRKTALRKTDAKLYSLGAIIADCCDEAVFAFSYSIGVATAHGGTI
jgi:hypothetical protein